MQWDSSYNAGFTSGKPWIKVNPNYKQINVENALRDKNSIFYYYQKLINLRKKHQAIVYGDLKMLMPDSENIFAYTRNFHNEILLVVLNFFEEEANFTIPIDFASIKPELLISNYDVCELENNFVLRPYEARVYKFTK